MRAIHQTSKLTGAFAISLLVVALSSPSSALASTGTGAIGWTPNSTVKKLVVTADGGIDVQLSPPLSGCVSHSNYGPTFASVLPSHPGLKQIKVDLQTAFVTGAPISLYLIDSDCNVAETILGGW